MTLEQFQKQHSENFSAFLKTEVGQAFAATLEYAVRAKAYNPAALRDFGALIKAEEQGAQKVLTTIALMAKKGTPERTDDDKPQPYASPNPDNNFFFQQLLNHGKTSNN